MWPAATSWSLWHTPQACTLIRISFAPGESMGTSLISNAGLSLPVSTAALKLFGRLDAIVLFRRMQSVVGEGYEALGRV